MLRTAASLHDRPAGALASCAAEAEREARLQSLVAHPNVLRVLQPPLGTASFALEWCDFDVLQARSVRAHAAACVALTVACAPRYWPDLRRRFQLRR